MYAKTLKTLMENCFWFLKIFSKISFLQKLYKILVTFFQEFFNVFKIFYNFMKASQFLYYLSIFFFFFKYNFS